MKKLINIIYDNIILHKVVYEDIMYEFEQRTFQIVQGNDVSLVSADYNDFRNYIEMYWRGSKWKHERNNMFVYQMGQLLAYTNMISETLDANKCN